MIERYIGEENAMAIKVLELHHHGIRVGATQEDADKTMKFYADVLGLSHDPGRPTIPTIPGYWMDVGGRAQIHLMGVNGQSKFAQGPGKDPSLPHVALAVPDIQEARKELDRLGASDLTMKFYADVPGLSHDPGRPTIPTIPGYWMDVGGRAQIHLMGVNGQSKFAQGPGKDPSLPHVALAVPDIQEARKELDRLGASYWGSEGVVGPRSQPIFHHG